MRIDNLAPNVHPKMQRVGLKNCRDSERALQASDIAILLSETSELMAIIGMSGGWYRDRTCDPYHVKEPKWTRSY